MKSLQLTKPHLLILVGLPGSGRSTFAKKFSELFRAPYVDIKSYAEHAASIDGLHETGKKIVGELIKTDQTIVYEGISGTRAERLDVAEIAKQAGYTPLLVWFQVNEQAALQRGAKNSRKAHPLLENVYKGYRFTEPNSREPYVVVSGMHTYPSQAKTVLRRLTELSGRAARPLETPKERTAANDGSTPRQRLIRIQ